MQLNLPTEGELLQEEGSAELYLIRAGAKLLIPSPYTLEALGFQPSDAKQVPAGSLDDIPTERWLSSSATPGSVVFVPDYKVWHPIDVATSRSHEAWGTWVRTVELRGWLVGLNEGCNPFDPDWHWDLFLDAGWAVEQGIELNRVIKAGNIMQHGQQEAGSNTRARVASPKVHIEASGFPILAAQNQNRKEPPDWQTFGIDCKCEFLPDKPQAKWPFDPRNPRPVDTPLVENQYVRVVGSIVSDQPHRDDFIGAFPELDMWFTGQFPWGQQNDPRNMARYTEIHPPDTIEVIDQREQTEVFRGVAVIAPGTFELRPRPETTLDVQIPLPPRPPGDQTLRIQELVDPESDVETIVDGNDTRTGARITRLDDSVRIYLTIAGRRSLFGGSNGYFKALYRVYWQRTDEPDLSLSPPFRVTCVIRRRLAGLTRSIVALGGVDAQGEPWQFSKQQVISAIERGETFYVQQDGKQVNLVVASRFGQKYLKTEADTLLTNNLAKLPSCY
jgi:hypothetical protein